MSPRAAGLPAALALGSPLGLWDQQCPDPRGEGEIRLERGPEPVPAPGRPDPEPRRDREGLRAAGARSADPGDRGPRQGDPDQGRRLDGHRPARSSGSSRRPRTSSRARSGACSRPSSAIRSCKSNANFLALQSQLEGTENRIAVARRDYIETVRAYNTELRTIPGRWIAGFLYPDAKPMETFAATRELRPAAGREVLAPMRPVRVHQAFAWCRRHRAQRRLGLAARLPFSSPAEPRSAQSFPP